MKLKPSAFLSSVVSTISSAALSTLFATACSSVRMAPHRLMVEKRWVRSTLQTEFLGGRRIHRFAPIVRDKMVIVANSIDGVVAYDRGGSVLWRLDVKDGSEGGGLIADDILYFGAGDGLLYAVQAETGSVVWTYPLKAEGIAKPLVKGGVVYVLGGNNVAHALNAKTGKLLWLYNRREASNLSVRGGAQPAIVGDLVLFGFSDGSLLGLNRSSGTVVWEANLNRNKRFRDVDATPVVDGEKVYVSSYDGALYALNGLDGRILWTVEDGGYDEALLHGNILYYSSSTGKTMALDKASGKTVWSQSNRNGIGTMPALYKGAVVVGEMDGELRFLDARTGEQLNSFAPGRGVTSAPAIDSHHGEVYFVSADANLYALKVDWRRFSREWPWE